MANITIWGKLGADAILRNTQGGDSVCSFSVAQDQRDGREKTTAWYRCSIWGKRAEALAPYLLKGTSVTVAGGLTVKEYEGKTQLNIRASEIALQGGRADGPRELSNNDRANSIPGSGNFADDDGDSIPF